MTKEEAIAELNKAMDEISLGSYTYDGLERSIALEIGIKALEQELCDDCISRAEVLNCIEAYCNNLSNEIGMHIRTNEMLDTIRQLPPVTPKPKTEDTESEEIDADSN